MSILWSEQLKIGIPVIDVQHKTSFVSQQSLADASLDSAVDESLRATLDMLETYARQHFADEEDFMRRCDSDKLASHIEEREFFINKVAEIKQEYQEMGLSKDLIWFVDHFLLHWITTHTMSLDPTLKDLFEQHSRWRLSNSLARGENLDV